MPTNLETILRPDFSLTEKVNFGCLLTRIQRTASPRFLLRVVPLVHLRRAHTVATGLVGLAGPMGPGGVGLLEPENYLKIKVVVTL